MRLDGWQSFTIGEAKKFYDAGSIKELRIDVLMGDYIMIAKGSFDERPIRTHRYEYKKYKSLDSIFKDYQYITSQEVKALILK